MDRKVIIISLAMAFLISSRQYSYSQCSVCTKTAQQLGEKPAKGLNAGIIYLAATPFLIAGVIFYRWKKQNRT